MPCQASSKEAECSAEAISHDRISAIGGPFVRRPFGASNGFMHDELADVNGPGYSLIKRQFPSQLFFAPINMSEHSAMS